MPHLGHDVPHSVTTLLTKAVGAVVIMVLFFVFRYIFELEFTCSCSPGIHLLGILYMVLPPCIIHLMLCAINKKYQKQLCNNTCISALAQQILQLLSTASIWIAAVLIDGDWYVCNMGNKNETYMDVPCKRKHKLNYDEQMFIVKHKNDSIVSPEFYYFNENHTQAHYAFETVIV